jgi:hypothetical protein
VRGARGLCRAAGERRGQTSLIFWRSLRGFAQNLPATSGWFCFVLRLLGGFVLFWHFPARPSDSGSYARMTLLYIYKHIETKISIYIYI